MNFGVQDAVAICTFDRRSWGVCDSGKGILEHGRHAIFALKSRQSIIYIQFYMYFACYAAFLWRTRVRNL